MGAGAAILRPRTARILRHLATRVVGPLLGIDILFAVSTLVLGHPTTDRYRAVAWVVAFTVIWSTEYGTALLVAARRTGCFAEGDEVGTITLGGVRRPARPRVVRWVRRTMVRRSEAHPVAFGMDADDRRVLTISGRHLTPAEVEVFLRATGLPADGDWSLEIGLREASAEYPSAHLRTPSPERLAQVRRWKLMLLVGAPTILLGSLGMAWLVAVALVH